MRILLLIICLLSSSVAANAQSPAHEKLEITLDDINRHWNYSVKPAGQLLKSENLNVDSNKYLRYVSYGELHRFKYMNF